MILFLFTTLFISFCFIVQSHSHLMGDVLERPKQITPNPFTPSVPLRVAANAAVHVTSGSSIVAACSEADVDVVTVGIGNYVEGSGFSLTGPLNITGEDREGCTLQKTNGGTFVLFILDNTGASLTIDNLTLLVTNQTQYNAVVRSSVTDPVAVSVVIRRCNIRMGKNTAGNSLQTIYGHSFYINNAEASLIFRSCSICSINCSTRPFIYVNKIHTLRIVDTSFANVICRSSTDEDIIGGCFVVISSINVLTLSRSQFVECSATKNLHGVGYVRGMTGDSNSILSCLFWNDTAFGNAGAMRISGDRRMALHNTSCVYCTADDEDDRSACGGAFEFRSMIPTLIDCSFTRCYCSHQGGALFLNSATSASFIRCTFVRNLVEGYQGGAIYIDKSNASLEYCLFFKNDAKMTYYGNDICLGLDPITLTIKDGVYTSIANVDNSIDGDYSPKTGMHTKAEYDNITCDDTFSAENPEVNGDCRMPCIASSGACEKPDVCADAEMIVVNGKCVAEMCNAPTCPSFSSPSLMCGNIEQCGGGRQSDGGTDFPCGDYCYLQLDGTCNTACGADSSPTDTGVCVKNPPPNTPNNPESKAKSMTGIIMAIIFAVVGVFAL